jgi:hypothetical protein
MTPDRTQYKQINTYRLKAEKRYSGAFVQDEPEQPTDAQFVVTDLSRRVDTLQDAQCPVIVRVEGDFLTLGTLVPAPTPPAPTPAKRRSATPRKRA